MKKIFSILLVCFLASCATKKDLVNKSNLDLPDWINSSEELTGVGIASTSKGSIKYQMAVAELDAKGNLAAKINSEISRITKNSLRSAKVNDNDDVEEFFAQATKEVVNNLPFQGVVRDKTYISKDGTLYVRVIMKPTDYSKSLNQSEKSMLEKLRNQHFARELINKSEEATKAIFDELEKERK